MFASQLKYMKTWNNGVRPKVVVKGQHSVKNRKHGKGGSTLVEKGLLTMCEQTTRASCFWHWQCRRCTVQQTQYHSDKWIIVQRNNIVNSICVDNSYRIINYFSLWKTGKKVRSCKSLVQIVSSRSITWWSVQWGRQLREKRMTNLMNIYYGEGGGERGERKSKIE